MPRAKPPRRKLAPYYQGGLMAPLYLQQALFMRLVTCGLSAGYTGLDAVKRATEAMIFVRDRVVEHKWGPREQHIVKMLLEGAIRAPGRDSGVTVGGRATDAATKIGEQLRDWKREHEAKRVPK